MKTLLPEILLDMDEYIRGSEGFKTQLVKVVRKNKELEAEVASLEKRLESETQSVLQELQEKQRLLELEEKERKLQNIPQEIIDRYNSADTKLKKMEDIAYE
jgi:regulator of replication initiation timing